MTNHNVPFIDLMAQQARLRPAIDAAIARVLDHGKYIMGPEVFEAEARLAEFCGAGEVVSTSSGTDALWLPLLALEIGHGDAVILPSFTFTATAEAVCLTGATPVFVDVDGRSFNMQADSIAPAVEAARGHGLTPRAVIPVDLFGLPADYTALNQEAKALGLSVIADAAQSFGGARDGRRVGCLADVTATSFFPAKPLGVYGDGGAIFTNDAGTAEALRSIRIHGRGEKGKYDNVRVGTNARLDTIQAAVLLQKLDIFTEELELRQAVAERYDRELGEHVTTPAVPANAQSAWAQYTVLVPERDRLATDLGEQGIPTQVYYPRPLHLQPPYCHAIQAPDGLPVTERLADEVLSLPMYPYLSGQQQDQVCNAIRTCMEAREKVANGGALQ